MYLLRLILFKCIVAFGAHRAGRGKEKGRDSVRKDGRREILITRSKWLEMFQTKVP